MTLEEALGLGGIPQNTTPQDEALARAQALRAVTLDPGGLEISAKSRAQLAQAREEAAKLDPGNPLDNMVRTIIKKEGAPVYRNNPGNLRFADQAGATDDNGWARFATPKAGVEALKKQISRDAGRDLTLNQFMGKYAPPKENNTGAYLMELAGNLGADPAAKLKDILTGQASGFKPMDYSVVGPPVEGGAPAVTEAAAAFPGGAAPGAPAVGAPQAPQAPQAPKAPSPGESFLSQLGQGPEVSGNSFAQQLLSGNAGDPANPEFGAMERNPQVSAALNKLVEQIMRPDEDIVKQRLQEKFPGKWGAAKRFSMDFLLSLTGQSVAAAEEAKVAKEQEMNLKKIQLLTGLQNQAVQYDKAMKDLAIKSKNNDARNLTARAVAQGRLVHWENMDVATNFMNEAKTLVMSGQLDKMKADQMVAEATFKSISQSNFYGKSTDKGYNYASHLAAYEMAQKYGVDVTTGVAPAHVMQEYGQRVLDHAKAYGRASSNQAGPVIKYSEGPTVWSNGAMEKTQIRYTRDLEGKETTEVIPWSQRTDGLVPQTAKSVEKLNNLSAIHGGFQWGWQAGLRAWTEAGGRTENVGSSGYFKPILATFQNAGWIGGPGNPAEIFSTAATTKTVSDLIFQYSGKQTTQKEREFFLLMMPSLQQRVDIQLTYNLLRGTAAKIEELKLSADPTKAAGYRMWQNALGVDQATAIEIARGNMGIVAKAIMKYTHDMIGSSAQKGTLPRLMATATSQDPNVTEGAKAAARRALSELGALPTVGDMLKYAHEHGGLDAWGKAWEDDEELKSRKAAYEKQDPSYKLSVIGNGRPWMGE